MLLLPVIISAIVEILVFHDVTVVCFVILGERLMEGSFENMERERE